MGLRLMVQIIKSFIEGSTQQFYLNAICDPGMINLIFIDGMTVEWIE
jgi:hypothetical protein